MTYSSFFCGVQDVQEKLIYRVGSLLQGQPTPTKNVSFGRTFGSIEVEMYIRDDIKGCSNSADVQS